MKHPKLMILASDSQSAIEAQKARIDRIFYDLEYIGKAERQHGRNTVKSNNSIDDILAVRKALIISQLLVRTNLIHAYSKTEIDKAIPYGADVLMLPMVTDQHDVEQYMEMVGGRARVCTMIETAAVIARLGKILAIAGVDEIFIGLDDLHISMGLTFMFETLSDDLVEYIAQKCNKVGMSFGFNGIARVGEGDLPSENMLGEHMRLGSTSMILSRTFKDIVGVDRNARKIDPIKEVQKIRSRLQEINQWTEAEYEENCKKITTAVDVVANKILNK